MRSANIMKLCDGAVPFPLFGALCRKNATQLFSTTPLDITWQVDEYDLTNWHDTSSNTARMTVPTGVGVQAVRCVSNLRNGSPNNPEFRHMRSLSGGAVALFNGSGRYRNAASSGTNLGYYLHNMVSAIVETSDASTPYFTTQYCPDFGTDSPGNHGHTYMGIESIDPALRRVMVQKNATQSLSAGVNTIATWQTTVYNTGGFTVNSDNIVVNFTGRIRITANCTVGNVANRLFLQPLVNSVQPVGCPFKASDVGGADQNNVATAVLNVTNGDVLKLQVMHQTATSIQNVETTWMCIEEVPTDYKCILLQKTATQSITNADTAINWDSVVYEDISTMWDVSTPSIVIAPFTGYFRQTIACTSPSAANMLAIWGEKASAIYYGSPGVAFSVGGSVHTGAMGAWAPCTVNDQIRMVARAITTRNMLNDANNFMCVEFRT